MQCIRWSEKLVRRAVTLIIRPAETWQLIALSSDMEGGQAWQHAALLALLASISWSCGVTWLQSDAGPQAGFFAILTTTFLLCMCAMLVTAVSVALLLPFYGRPRCWRGAWTVAAYGATPPLLCGMLLFIPIAMMLLVVTFPYGCYLQSLGAQQVLGVRKGDAAEFTGASLVLSMVICLGMGGLLSASGLL
jgi:hypothetical protein